MLLSGDALLFAPWAGGVPSSEGHKCAVMSYRVSVKYEWSDSNCQESHSFICERRKYPAIEFLFMTSLFFFCYTSLRVCGQEVFGTHSSDTEGPFTQ